MVGDIIVERQEVRIFRLAKARDECVLFCDHLAPIGRSCLGLDTLEPHRRGIGGVDALDRADQRLRSEERRVGKECVSTCRSRWSADTLKKQTVSVVTGYVQPVN